MSIISPNYLPFVQLLVANSAYNNIPTSIRKFLFISAKNSKLLLMRAINENNIPMVKLLLNNGADVNIIDIHQESPLLCAIKKNNIKIVKLLLDNGASANEEICDISILIRTIISYTNNTEIIQLLLDRGADINAMHNGKTPLLYSIMWMEYNIEFIKLLLINGANVNKKTAPALNTYMDGVLYNKISSPPLIYAINNNNVELVKLFINSGADVNLCDDFNGNTPLIEAIKIKNIEIIKLLLKSGADIYIADHMHYTALDWAIKELTFSRNFPNLIFKTLPPMNYIYNSYHILISFQPFVNKHNRKELLTYMAAIKNSYQSNNKIGKLFKSISHNKFKQYLKMHVNSFLSTNVSDIIH